MSYNGLRGVSKCHQISVPALPGLSVELPKSRNNVVARRVDSAGLGSGAALAGVPKAGGALKSKGVEER